MSGTTKQWDDGTIYLNGGTLDTGTLDLTEHIFNMLDGLLRADSVIGDINVPGGIVTPRHISGVLTITGDYTQAAVATLEIELGRTATEEFDQLTSPGTVDLDGTLGLVPLMNWQPSYTDPAPRGTADEFVIITAGEHSGSFSTVRYDGSPLSADFGPDSNGSFRNHQGCGMFPNISYTSTTVELQNLLALQGDVDGDKDVDITDFNFLASNFAPDGYGASNAIPEPSSFILCVFGILAVSRFVSRREVG